MLYGMVFWSQYLVIGYGNLPEEISFVFLRQNVKPWEPVSYLMLGISLLAPFCILLSRAVKKNPALLAGTSLLILAGLWLERYILVAPSLWSGAGDGMTHAAGPAAAPTTVSLPLGIFELAVTLGFAAAFLLSYDAFARAFPITRTMSPRPAARH